MYRCAVGESRLARFFSFLLASGLVESQRNAKPWARIRSLSCSRGGLEGPETVANFKAALMGPLAALGDGFFWLSLKPAAGALCAGLVPVLQAWAAVIFLAIYNALHLPLRVRFYCLGLRLGDRVVDALAKQDLPKRGAKLRALGAASAGALAAWLAIVFGRNETGPRAPALAAGCLVLGAVSYWLVAKRATSYALLYFAALIAAVTGAFLG